VVWRTAQRLHAALAGRLLTVTDLRWPSLATVDLTGRPVLEVVSAGKHLLTRIGPTAGDPDGAVGAVWTLHSHLRMEGSWHVHRSGVPWRGGRPDHGIRAVLANQEWTAVGHRLGMLDLVPTARETDLVGHLGPDLLGPGWDATTAVSNLRAEPDRPVGEALLDQRVLAGVGTFFMCEALFLRGVTPWTPVSGASAYAAYYGTAAGVTKITGTRVSGITAPPHVVSGLTNGTPYHFVVTAVGAGGESAESAEASATPAPAQAFTQADLTGDWDVLTLSTNSSPGWSHVLARLDAAGQVEVLESLDDNGDTALPPPGSVPSITVASCGTSS